MRIPLTFLIVVAACDIDSNSSNPISLGRSSAELSNSQLVSKIVLDEKQDVRLLAGDLGASLSGVASLFRADDSELRLVASDWGPMDVQVERYEQFYKGLPVIGGDFRVNRDIDGQIKAASGIAWDLEKPATVPEIDPRDAAVLAKSSTEGAQRVGEAYLVYVAPSDGGKPALAYNIRVTGHNGALPVDDQVFVDALDGEIVDRHPQIHSALNRQTYDADGQEDFGQLIRSENQGPTGNTDVDNAHITAGETYDCLLAKFGRDSYDGNGATITSITDFGTRANAFWSAPNKVFGFYQGFTVSDVQSHEIAHAITTSTANMVYQNEPGALNEAWSDIMSSICDEYKTKQISANTWLLGEQLPGGAIRNMANPTEDGISTDHYQTRYVGPEDNGGVHWNSGIANLAFHLLVVGGSHPRVQSETVQGIGMDEAGQIFYRALTNHMNTNTQFSGARTATELAADELFGAGSPQSISVSEAWAAVGVGEPAPKRTGSSVTGGDDGKGNNAEGGQVNGEFVAGCSNSSAPAALLAVFVMGMLISRKKYTA